MRVEEYMLVWKELSSILDELQGAINACDQAKLHELLLQVVPGFKLQCEIMDVMYDEV
jgi:hypothetical protein